MGGKTALITGGATGIGKRTAYQLAENDVHLVINYRKSKVEAVSLAEELSKNFGTKNIAIGGDITTLEECQRAIDEALAVFSNIDILVHNAGPYMHERKVLTEYSFGEWNYIINGNLNALFYLSKLLLPRMREKGWGRIITIGFDRVETVPGWIYRSAFAAAKCGAASLTKTIALEEAKHQITANMVCPGDITEDWKEKEIFQAVEVINDDTPIGRPGTGEDIARVISFLIDEKSDFITGSIIPVTGGKDVLGKVFRD
ncbi:SDR family oxidoreductase [Bacillus sp. DTU_2020_1000418_1_SI_GHA_SEK_038]|uniref:SDR family oxidoreductase n=1 Tax=Bacillus sp. DTU_2020_1000418_1_SI_GHA_SEK_038 TaxID=3077585 RepID=UPI0028E49968|nr:SDR family oxidoreductase [Bacillus sp. DTU_2020_1000418_1_SI_GHA_SEK_038]WNS73866.1 SDR family oxidoreductase [Bacillus sp. DTU_2020_1000418_1_SI_GHA_SEK_038]